MSPQLSLRFLATFICVLQLLNGIAGHAETLLPDASTPPDVLTQARTYSYGGRYVFYTEFNLDYCGSDGSKTEIDSGDVFLSDAAYNLYGPHLDGNSLPLDNVTGVAYQDASVIVENVRKTDNDTLAVTKYQDRVHFRVTLTAGCNSHAHRYIRITVRGRKHFSAGIALLGVGWNTIPVAFSRGDGSFDVTNAIPFGNFLSWYSGSPTAHVLVGKFDGLSTDIALLQPGWSTIPITHSLGEGRFDVSNGTPDGHFLEWYTGSPVATIALGDFDGDNATDVALLNGSWTTIPIALARAGGDFHVTNDHPDQNFLPWFASSSDSRVIVGDFNGDFKDDILLFDPGFTTIPVAFSLGDGNFHVTNRSADTAFQSLYAGGPYSRIVVADFNFDGRDDIALVMPGATTIPVAFSNGDGTFKITSEPLNVPFLASYGLTRSTQIVVADFHGDDSPDIVLLDPDMNTVAIAHSNGNGSFRVTNESLSAPFLAWYGNAPRAHVLVSDFNSDGRADVGLLNPGWNTIPVAFSSNSGGFEVTNAIPTGGFLNWYTSGSDAKVVVGDFKAFGN